MILGGTIVEGPENNGFNNPHHGQHRYFLASAQNLCNQVTNRTLVYEAMKRVMKNSLEYKHSIYVKNLYVKLKMEKIGTTTIETLSRKLCSTLPKHRTRTLVKIVTQWKLQDAYTHLREMKRRNTEVWRKEKETIDAAHRLYLTK